MSSTNPWPGRGRSPGGSKITTMEDIKQKENNTNAAAQDSIVQPTKRMGNQSWEENRAGKEAKALYGNAGDVRNLNMADSPPCYLLEKIPAELRNRIYQLVFAPYEEEVNKAGEINLCKAKFPPKNLIFTCRQIHSEAAKMYKAEYQRYWRSTKFGIDRFRMTRCLDALHALKEEDIEQVTQLRIQRPFFTGEEHFYLLPECRSWKRRDHSGQETFLLPYLTGLGIAEFSGCPWMIGLEYKTYEELMEDASQGTLPGSIKDHVLWLALGCYELDVESEFDDGSETDGEDFLEQEDEEDFLDEEDEEDFSDEEEEADEEAA
ncbi:hypothetical protein AC579_6044 [Pseudocercospora musae]|uniref:Uncharacterized protein n=1 Tax=Pseudocercospora musae TaxID=113226 RepID=A0A139IFD4_9PEZI|nr:hypothetical protein AC579_6044 [Pseudocercospora musae]